MVVILLNSFLYRTLQFPISPLCLSLSQEIEKSDGGNAQNLLIYNRHPAPPDFIRSSEFHSYTMYFSFLLTKYIITTVFTDCKLYYLLPIVITYGVRIRQRYFSHFQRAEQAPGDPCTTVKIKIRCVYGKRRQPVHL